jgi:hypothetical protein
LTRYKGISTQAEARQLLAGWLDYDIAMRAKRERAAASREKRNRSKARVRMQEASKRSQFPQGIVHTDDNL